MTDNVTHFPGKKAEPLIFTCACGCRSFSLMSDGTIECANCNHTDYAEIEAEWLKQTEAVKPSETPRSESEAGTLNVKRVGSPELARRRTMKGIQEWSDADQLAFVFAYNLNAGGKHWLNIETQEQKEWIIDKLEFIMKTLKDTAV